MHGTHCYHSQRNKQCLCVLVFGWKEVLLSIMTCVRLQRLQRGGWQSARMFCCCGTLITRGFRRPRTIRILSAGFFKPDYFRSLVTWLDGWCKLSLFTTILDTTYSAYIISVARVLEMAFIGFAFCSMQVLSQLVHTEEDLTKLPASI